MDREQRKRYEEVLKNIPEPIRLKDRPKINLDMRGIMDYAEQQGKKIIELSAEEKAMFTKKELVMKSANQCHKFFLNIL